MTATRIALCLALLAIGGTSLFAGCSTGPPVPEKAESSVFVYLIDTLRPDHLGCYGYERDISPNIDAFASDAIRFERAQSPAPWTRPAVASLFTGMPPLLHGARGRAGVLPQAFTTWAEALQSRGYRTVAVLTNQTVDHHFGFNQGFDFFHIVQRGDSTYVRSDQMHEDWVPFLDVPSDGLLFHYLHSMDPHHPYKTLPQFRLEFDDDVAEQLAAKAPEKWVPQAERFLNDYDREIYQQDHSFKMFVDELKQRGLYEDSWIVVVSDHGEEFWEHGGFGHGHALYENLLHVPLIIRPPGGRASEHVAALDKLAARPFPIHAIGDLIGERLTRTWDGLGASNARLLELDPQEIDEHVPQPTRLVPQTRRASFTLDGKGGVMMERKDLKVIWDDAPSHGWSAFDLTMDPAELAVLDPLPTPAAGLQADIGEWVDRTARGLELSYDGRGPGPRMRLMGDRGLKTAFLPPGEMPKRFAIRRGGSLAWTPERGGRLFVELAPGSTLSVSLAGGALAQLWPRDEDERNPVNGLEIRERNFGAAVFDLEPGVDFDQLPAHLLRHLQALGYID